MRHELTKDERSRGGRNQSRDVKVEAGRKGFQVTMERHPWMFNRLKYAPGMKRFNPDKFCPKQVQDG